MTVQRLPRCMSEEAFEAAIEMASGPEGLLVSDLGDKYWGFILQCQMQDYLWVEIDGVIVVKED